MTGVDPGVNCRVHQYINERLLGAVMAEQDDAQTAQSEVLRHVIARLARHDDIRTGGDGKLAKVAEGAAQNGDAAARVLGFAPYARVAAKGRGGTVGEIAQIAGVMEGRECAQTGELGLVHMLQRTHGLSAQQFTQASTRFVRAVQVGVKRDDAHAATSCLVQRSAALGTRYIRRAKRLGRLDVDGMMRQQHVGAGLESAVHVGYGRVECAGNTGDLSIGITHR